MARPVIRVVHYLNQFFAGIGGDEKADVGPSVIEGPAGPGRLLQQMLSGEGTVVATVVCGDNFISGMPGFGESHRKKAINVLQEVVEKQQADVVIAGPAFVDGRYGIGCGEICRASRLVGVPAITAMHPDNVAVPLYVDDVYIVPTGESPAEMGAVMKELVRLAMKLANEGKLDSPEEEGYLSPDG